MKYADLHIHSKFSDSTLDVKDVFTEAKSRNVDCVSVTDHDTLDFYRSNQIDFFSQKYSVEIIKGIEFSSSYQGKEVHLLGYFGDDHIGSINFLNILGEIKKERRRRIFKMIDKLKGLNIDIDKEEFIDFLGESNPSRLHLAILLIKEKVVPNIREAFNQFIGPGKPAFVPRFHYEVDKAIPLLKKEGALIFLAHPLTLGDDEKVKDIISLGIDGIEVFYPVHKEKSISYYKELAQRHSLLISGGSDAHGDYKRYTEVGSVKMDYKYALDIKEALISSLK